MNSGRSANRVGPGMKLCTMKTASIIAVSASPGMPSASSGTRAEAGTALFAVSQAIRPSGAPLPNRSGVFEKRRAVE